MFKRGFLMVVLLLVVFTVGCQLAEPEVVEVPVEVEVEVTRIVEVLAEQSLNESPAESPALFPHFATDVRSYSSEVTGRDYTVYVTLPLSYEMTAHTYPAVYVTDGDWFTLPTALTAGMLAYGGPDVPEVITVGIGYGGTAVEAFRLREADMFGEGSKPFLRFLQEELIPDIEANYRIDATERTLMGHSLGGQFALYTMYNAPDTFQNIIASSPDGSLALSLHNYHGNELDALPVRMYTSLGGLEGETVSDFEEFSAALQDSDYDEFACELEILDGESHMSVWSRAFTSGLRWVFEDWDGTYSLQ
jgi:predicted alpha/beta superfamily hydrolase